MPGRHHQDGTDEGSRQPAPDSVSDASSIPNGDLIPATPGEQTALEGILQIFIKSAHIDFSHYRQTTVLRRITRRISLSNKSDYAGYLAFLLDNPEEVELLYDDLLLSHTEFFRDPAVFEALKREVFPALVAHRPAKTPIRVWVAGCSTGEEVYSLAICLHEYLAQSKSCATAQFFGTDLNLRHITTARKGIYPDKIRKTVSPERLARYFDQTPEGIMVTKQIREMCVFAVQDVTQDPPFPSIDLVSCRNVLIYFDAALQDAVIPLFHFALKTTGYLLLGSSESMGKFTELFSPVNQNINLYTKRFTRGKTVYRFPVGRISAKQHFDTGHTIAPGTTRVPAGCADLTREIDTVLLDAFAPPCLVVDGNMQIRQFRGDMSPYLTPAPGEASLKLSRMTKDGLMPDIYVAIEEAKKKQGRITRNNIAYRQNDTVAMVDLSVIPIPDPSTGEMCFLITFEKSTTPYDPRPGSGEDAGDEEPELIRLRNELQSTKAHLQSIVEEKDEVNQEMWAANEEIQSTNEELQSVNEEMEAAKEELEASNEELIALNEEMLEKNRQLRESEEKFRFLVWNMQVGVILQGPKTEILLANPLALELLGLTEDQLLGKTSFDPDWNVIHEDGSPFPGSTHPVSQAIATRCPVRDVVMGVYRPVQKDRVWLLVDAEPQLGESADVLRVVCTFIDITARKKAESALHESEMIHRSIIESSPMGMYQYDLKPDGRLVFTGANPAADRIVGVDNTQFIGKTIEEAFPPLAVGEVPARYREVAATGVMWETDQVEYADDTIRGAFHVVAFRIGKNRMVAMFLDITARKQMEQALRENESRYKMVTELATDYVYRINVAVNGSVSLGFVSDNFYPITGRRREDALSVDSWRAIVHPDDLGDVMMFLQKLTITPLADELECRSFVQGQKQRWISIVAKSEWNNEEKRVVAILGAVKDITARKQAEIALRVNNDLLKLFISNSPIYCYIKEVSATHSTVLHASENYRQMVGIAGSQMIGKTMEDLYPPEFAAKISADDRAVVSNCQVLRLDEELNGRSYTTIKFPIVLGDTTLLAGYTIDITERKQTEEALRNTQKLESLGVLAGGIAHDFNNLMGGIFGYIDLARDEPDKNQVFDYLERAMNTINRARGLTAQLLTFSKGGAPIQKIESLFPFVQETAQFALSGSNVSCRFNIPGNIHPCNIDKNQIGQVIDNIIINAQQAMPGGGTIDVTAVNVTLAENEHPVLAPGRYVKISVADHGCGITKEVMPRIFDPFFTTKPTGHGLGLPTCYSIIKRHGGAIDVESEPGEGSTFHVFLPASVDSTDEQTVPATDHKGCGTIIIMDDEEVMRDTLEAMLQTLGYGVLCTTNGREAVALFINETNAGHPVTGVILDLTVPGGMGGKAAIEEIRTCDRETPVFVVSGYADDPVMKNPVQHGFTASLCKPFMRMDLGAMLHKYLHRP